MVGQDSSGIWSHRSWGNQLPLPGENCIWFSYAGERIGQGRENARTFLKENKDIQKKLEGEVRKKLNIGQPAPQPAAQTPPATQGARVTTMPTGTDTAKVAGVKR